jgi:hypothetical protein
MYVGGVARTAASHSAAHEIAAAPAPLHRTSLPPASALRSPSSRFHSGCASPPQQPQRQERHPARPHPAVPQSLKCDTTIRPLRNSLTTAESPPTVRRGALGRQPKLVAILLAATLRRHLALEPATISGHRSAHPGAQTCQPGLDQWRRNSSIETDVVVDYRATHRPTQNPVNWFVFNRDTGVKGHSAERSVTK